MFVHFTTKKLTPVLFFSAKSLTALDLWMVACICFSFFSLMEFGIVLIVKAYYEKHGTVSCFKAQKVESQTRKSAWNIPVTIDQIKLCICYLTNSLGPRCPTLSPFATCGENHFYLAIETFLKVSHIEE
jgi:hypothetical protein